MYNLTIVLIIYSGILTMCVMSAAIGIIIIGVKRVRNLKKYVNYIDNVTMLLADKITNVNDGYNKELDKLKTNVYIMENIIRDVMADKNTDIPALTDDEIKLFDCVNNNYCEDTIKQENNQDDRLFKNKFSEHSEHKLYTLLRGGSL